MRKTSLWLWRQSPRDTSLKNTNVRLKCKKSKIERSKEILPSTRVLRSNISSVPHFRLTKSRRTRTRSRFWRKVLPKSWLILRKKKKWSATSTNLSLRSNVKKLSMLVKICGSKTKSWEMCELSLKLSLTNAVKSNNSSLKLSSRLKRKFERKTLLKKSRSDRWPNLGRVQQIWIHQIRDQMEAWQEHLPMEFLTRTKPSRTKLIWMISSGKIVNVS